MRLITRFGVAGRHPNAIIDDNFWLRFSTTTSPFMQHQDWGISFIVH